jgi:predicted NBD/HSP70 family sugar kinase
MSASIHYIDNNTSPFCKGIWMTERQHVFIGTDSGATSSKTGGVWEDGSTISTQLAQQSTNAQAGTDAVVRGWMQGTEEFLKRNGLVWDQVQGVGLAMPGPYKRYGVLGRSPNLPATFEDWDFCAAYSRALAERAGRPVPLVTGNDGNYGGVAEARHARGSSTTSVVMLAPGSGLGTAFVGASGLPLEGDSLNGMEAGHMPVPLQLLDTKPYPCGCGRTWGCVEVYTTISGLPYLLAERLPRYPDHELARSPLSPKEKALSLRGRAQKGDPLALEIFDFQAKVMGIHAANLSMALDPGFVVIGGGPMDPGSTTDEFRARYLRILRETMEPLLWPAQKGRISIVPAALGDLSQAIGAALVALYQHKG